MNILTKEQFRDILFEHYKEHYGVEYGDVWYDTTGVNVSRSGAEIRLLRLNVIF